MLGAILRSVGRDYLNLSLRTGAGLRVRVYERPGLWMDSAALDALRVDLHAVAAQCLPDAALDYGVFDPASDALKRSIVTIVSDDKGRPIAINALALMTLDILPEPIEVLHLGLVMVVPDQRQRKLSWVLYGLTCFLIFIRRQMRPVWITSVTQVPAVVGMVDQMFTGVWPSPKDQPHSLSHMMIARAVMADHRHVFGVADAAGFDADRFVITDAYTGGSDALAKTWDVAAKHRDDAYNAFCADQLDYARGDDLLQVGQMDVAAMRTYLSREVPRGAILRILGAAAMVGLSRIVLPLTYWADSSKAWGILRPSGWWK
ncbi:MAG: hypothetical protein ACJAXK_001946 [Yoonia sp.]|jgi:hypothetical protein